LKLILASQSPYRRELLSRLGVPFEQADSGIDEDQWKKNISNPEELVKTLAYQKAKAIYQNHSEAIVIASDQVAELEGKILGKPHTIPKAVEQLQSMAGKTHRLLTAVCLIHPQGTVEWTDITSLTMRALDLHSIENYVEKDRPLDCAGSYKIESLGIALFDQIDTRDFTAITGLPLQRLSHELISLGLEVL
jgi:septum formation protein